MVTKVLRFGRAGGKEGSPCIPVQWGAALPLEALETLQTNNGWVKRAARKIRL